MNVHHATKFTVAFNGDDNLIAAISRFQGVESVFGKLSQDVVGGGRPTSSLANFGMENLKKSIRVTHEHNIKFNYLLNSICMGNLEFSRATNNRINELIDNIVEAGADGVVVAIPYLLTLIKKRYPNLKVSISSFNGIDTPHKAKYWEDSGADRLILSQDIYRNRTALEKIRQTVKCELEIFANLMCVHQCPYYPMHPSAQGHASNSTNALKGFGVDYYSFKCTERRLGSPTEFIKGRFIRPEDLGVYQEIGIDVFKISDRLRNTPWLVRAVKAYTSGRYDGNLTNIISYPLFREKDEVKMINPIPFVAKSKHINMAFLMAMRDLAIYTTPVHIDNRKLDGFLDYFFTKNCENTICGVECSYCDSVAKQAVTVNLEEVEKYLAAIRKITGMLEDRRAFAKDNAANRVAMTLLRLFNKKSNNFGAVPQTVL